MELVLAQRLLQLLERRIEGGTHAYQTGRSTAAILADLDRHVTDNTRKKWATCVMGLSVAGAFDSAPLVASVQTFVECGAPAVLRRL